MRREKKSCLRSTLFLHFHQELRGRLEKKRSLVRKLRQPLAGAGWKPDRNGHVSRAQVHPRWGATARYSSSKGRCRTGCRVSRAEETDWESGGQGRDWRGEGCTERATVAEHICSPWSQGESTGEPEKVWMPEFTLGSRKQQVRVQPEHQESWKRFSCICWVRTARWAEPR